MTILNTVLANNLAWQLDQLSRFRYRNMLASYYRVQQAGHTFGLGDVVYLRPDASYAAVDANTVSIVAAVGPVSSVGTPGADWFSYRPVGRVVQHLSPALPGVPGELIYLTQTGLANVAPSRWATPRYIQLETNTTGIALDRGVDTAGTLGYASRTYVVADQNTANATVPSLNLGDQIFVDDAGLGEWTHYLMHQGTLRALTTQDSVRVDAETLEVTITPATPLQTVVIGNQTLHAVAMGNVSATRSVTAVVVTVATAFAANATLSVGTNTAAELIMPNALIDLTVPGSYAYQPALEFSNGYTSIYTFVNYGGTATGNAVISVGYL